MTLEGANLGHKQEAPFCRAQIDFLLFFLILDRYTSKLVFCVCSGHTGMVLSTVWLKCIGVSVDRLKCARDVSVTGDFEHCRLVDIAKPKLMLVQYVPVVLEDGDSIEQEVWTYSKS
jgi:hypothetical protein